MRMPWKPPRRLARDYGLLVGISSGANVVGSAATGGSCEGACHHGAARPGRALFQHSFAIAESKPKSTSESGRRVWQRE